MTLTASDFEAGDRVYITGIAPAKGLVIRVKDGFVEVQPDGYSEAEPFDAFRLIHDPDAADD